MNRIFAAAFCFSMVACGVGVEPTEPGLSPSEGAGRSSKTTTASVTLRSTNNSSGTPIWLTSYTINNTSSIYFATDLVGITGHHTQKVFVSMPGGSAYQTLSVAFAAGVAAASGEQQAQAISGGYRVWVSMPVAGTIIQQYNLTGPWSAAVTLDSATTPASSLAFALN